MRVRNTCTALQDLQSFVGVWMIYSIRFRVIFQSGNQLRKPIRRTGRNQEYRKASFNDDDNIIHNAFHDYLFRGVVLNICI